MKCTFETRERSSKMNVWIEPLEWDAKEEGKGSNVVEMKGEEDTKDTEQGKNEEAETNVVKEGEPPIVQIDVEVESFVAGEPVRASRAIGAAPHENCASSFICSVVRCPVMRANLARVQGCSTGPSRIAR